MLHLACKQLYLSPILHKLPLTLPCILSQLFSEIQDPKFIKTFDPDPAIKIKKCLIPVFIEIICSVLYFILVKLSVLFINSGVK